MTNFTFDRTVDVVHSAEDAWGVMTDVPKLVSWIDVLTEAREIERLKQYSAVISDRVGMFSLRADLDITVRGVDEPRSISVRAQGRDRQLGSRITIEATINVTDTNDGCDVRVTGHYEITGRAATLGSSQIKRKGDKVLQDFFDHLQGEGAPAR